ncbi:MAG TPA: cupin domain-containing protein [Acetobacteraceae bacterium]|nr:cupin domain-containing protein [Acetobacteraceae bacterium]
MRPAQGNLFEMLPLASAREGFDALVTAPGLKVQRIVSRGQASPPDLWYDQDWNEWVLLVSGSAGIAFEGEVDMRSLRAGDHLLIPAHCRHRVAWTDDAAPTIWLAVHFAGVLE